ncbi:toll/interleukin-1 receptor (TIR) domain-containing protein (chloroplast) [Artemisia annua]|uniref:ADP-ribosyl cyclase/cyclic ADP-ribose hydrolase n=1 Tax=Artemisia annua TaxID=35608 RepID=A0A2U1PJZ9_ARTAN|nr:toll/interleukin-1 receptor (TIR) domain-containing protein [Artemisia annua]
MGQRVLPVFYHVDPSDVRGQKRKFGTAFQQQEVKFRGEPNKMNKWREALVAASNLAGFSFSKSDGLVFLVHTILSDHFVSIFSCKELSHYEQGNTGNAKQKDLKSMES